MPSIPEIDPTALQKRLDEGDIQLLDVRAADERAIVSLGGLHIPITELPERLDELDEYRDTPLVVYCRSGARSGQVVRYLQSMGFTNVHNLKGGTNAWSREVDPSLPTY